LEGRNVAVDRLSRLHLHLWRCLQKLWRRVRRRDGRLLGRGSHPLATAQQGGMPTDPARRQGKERNKLDSRSDVELTETRNLLFFALFLLHFLHFFALFLIWSKACAGVDWVRCEMQGNVGQMSPEKTKTSANPANQSNDKRCESWAGQPVAAASSFCRSHSHSINLLDFYQFFAAASSAAARMKPRTIHDINDDADDDRNPESGWLLIR
jgi:hypothetical protein